MIPGESVEFTTTLPHDGAFAEYVSWPADLCYPLPERVPTVEGALCELLSVGSTRSDGGISDPATRTPDYLPYRSSPIDVVRRISKPAKNMVSNFVT